MKRKIKNNVRNLATHPIRKAAKFSAKAVGGVIGGTLGLAVGMTTGKPLQGAIVGVKGGSNLTGVMTDKISNALTVDDTKDTFAQGYYGDEYREHLQKKESRQWRNEHEEELIRNLGKERYKKLKKDRVLEDYNSAGVYDVEDIIAGEKFRDKRREEGYTCDTDDAIRAVKIANQIGDYDGMSAKSKKEAEDTLRRNYMENNPDTSKESVERFMNDQIKFIKEINSDKKKMI